MKVKLKDGRVWNFEWNKVNKWWEYKTKKNIYCLMVDLEGFNNELDIWIGRYFKEDRVIVTWGKTLGVKEIEFSRGKIIFGG